MTLDYDLEYNTRAPVPNHPEIFARMADAAREYRTRAAAAGHAALDISYGSSKRQVVDIFYSPAGRDAPLTIFIHGGFWRSFQPSAFSHVAAGLNARGVTVALPGYDLCPHVSIAQIVDQMRQACMFLHKSGGQRPIVFGHSAGGHLAACLLATEWQSLGAPADLVPAAMGLSGLYDLTPMIRTAMNADFRLDDAEARRMSPLFQPAPGGKTFDAIVGGTESSEFLRQSREVAEVWGKAGVTTRFEALTGVNHFTILDPLADPNSAMVKRLLELCGVS